MNNKGVKLMVKCLIVDDDYKILHYVSQHLETAQIQTVTQAVVKVQSRTLQTIKSTLQLLIL